VTERQQSHGLFIALEGGEGAGKSVQAEALGARLEAAGRSVVVTREPGGTPLGERLRSVLLDLSGTQIDPLSETLLFMAARAELVATTVRPALARGDVVVCDRFADSTRAYQGFGRGIDLAVIDKLNAIATGGLEPDVVVLLDLAPAEGLARRPASGKSDRFEQEELAFHERVRNGYRTLAANDPERWLVIDAAQPREAITEAICARLAPKLGSLARA
jgi:dTMP kinase